jgi:periplasmic protein TonB
MKKILFTLIASVALLTAKAQTSTADTTVYSVVEKLPEFPGGMNTFNRYLQDNIHYPAVAKQHGTHGRVLLTLVIEKDGSVSHVKVSKGVSPEIDREAVRVVMASPKWAPGMEKGKVVRVSYTLPVYFDLSGK